jgi:hypothetical protein
MRPDKSVAVSIGMECSNSIYKTWWVAITLAELMTSEACKNKLMSSSLARCLCHCTKLDMPSCLDENGNSEAHGDINEPQCSNGRRKMSINETHLPLIIPQWSSSTVADAQGRPLASCRESLVQQRLFWG